MPLINCVFIIIIIIIIYSAVGSQPMNPNAWVKSTLNN